MIHTLLQSWADSPIKTTIETLQIFEIVSDSLSTKHSYTDLNYDLMLAENFTLSEGDELVNNSWKVINEHTFTDDFNMFQEENGYYSLHHGYTHIRRTYTDKNGHRRLLAAPIRCKELRYYKSEPLGAHCSLLRQKLPPDMRPLTQ